MSPHHGSINFLQWLWQTKVSKWLWKSPFQLITIIQVVVISWNHKVDYKVTHNTQVPSVTSKGWTHSTTHPACPTHQFSLHASLEWHLLKKYRLCTSLCNFHKYPVSSFHLNKYISLTTFTDTLNQWYMDGGLGPIKKNDIKHSLIGHIMTFWPHFGS